MRYFAPESVFIGGGLSLGWPLLNDAGDSGFNPRRVGAAHHAAATDFRQPVTRRETRERQRCWARVGFVSPKSSVRAVLARVRIGVPPEFGFVSQESSATSGPAIRPWLRVGHRPPSLISRCPTTAVKVAKRDEVLRVGVVTRAEVRAKIRGSASFRRTRLPAVDTFRSKQRIDVRARARSRIDSADAEGASGTRAPPQDRGKCAHDSQIGIRAGPPGRRVGSCEAEKLSSRPSGLPSSRRTRAFGILSRSAPCWPGSAAECRRGRLEDVACLRSRPRMIIVLKPNPSPEQVRHVVERIEELGFVPHLSQGVVADHHRRHRRRGEAPGRAAPGDRRRRERRPDHEAVQARQPRVPAPRIRSSTSRA